jgi:hypothetical protein
MEELLTLPGVARKTANVVLGTWFKKAEGVVVDTHVHRISRRLELTTNDDPQKIEQDLMLIIPREKWILFLPPNHLAWTQTLHRSQTQVCRLCLSKIFATPPTRPGARSRCTRTRKRDRDAAWERHNPIVLSGPRENSISFCGTLAIMATGVTTCELVLCASFRDRATTLYSLRRPHPGDAPGQGGWSISAVARKRLCPWISSVNLFSMLTNGDRPPA